MKHLIEYLHNSKGNSTGCGPRNEVWSEVSELQAENERLRNENEAHRTEGIGEHEAGKCGELCPWCEVERLRGIVERLPVTADGMPVVPGNVLYGLDANGKVCQCETALYAVDVTEDGDEEEPYGIVTEFVWSTRTGMEIKLAEMQAAEAAQQPDEGEGGEL